MSATQQDTAYDVYSGVSDGAATRIGRLAIGARGMLAVVEADPLFAEPLRSVVDAVNAQESLRIKAPPPPNEAEGGIAHDTVLRDDPQAGFAVRELMEQKYDLRMVAAGAPVPT